MKLAVIGAGWAGLAAAVRATQAGHAVTLFEMAPRPGGRARSLEGGDAALDNGQHILIGAYTRTLALMQTVGADPAQLLHRRPLDLRYPDGAGLRLPAGPALLTFALGVAQARGLGPGGRRALLGSALGWARRGFRCEPGLTVAGLCANMPPALRERFIDPLCVAALNTPAAEASAEVMLRVLKDALFSGRGSADLLLPRRPLAELLPQPAWHWLQGRGATLHASRRVQALQPAPTAGAGWRVDGEAFDGVVLATSAAEAARLTGELAPAWSARAALLRYEPIVTVYLQAAGARLPAPMTALREGPESPAQFAFDHGALGGEAGRFAFVISGARRWAEAGAPATAAAVLAQARRDFPSGTWPTAPTVLRVITEKRATFRCTPALDRPPAAIGPGLVAAGDYVAGPYPATLEGAVRAGEAAAVAALQA